MDFFMRTLHLVSHTHWDREWYLTLQQFRLKLVYLIDGLLDLLEQDKNYKYFMLDGQTIVLDDYLLMRPEREDELRRHIQRGRILIGPWYVLPDEFLVSPEATIRNLLQGERTAHKFGAKMMVGYIPDPFGHIGQMPQILRGFDIQYAAFRRGLSDEPCELWWQAPDGSRVFTTYLRDGYDNAAGLPTSEPERFVSEVRRLRDSLSLHSAGSSLLLMQGTDHMEPPPDTSQAIQAAKGKLDGDKLIQSTLPVYLTAIHYEIQKRKIEIPSVVGELRSPKRHHLLPGVLSTRMWIKQRNRACEALLEKWAEPFSTFARWQARISELQNADANILLRNPAPILRQTWRLLMECHPHDSICGCSIDQVHEEMRPRFDQVEQICEELTRQSLNALAAAIDTPGSMEGQELAIVVFNPTAGPRTDLVELEFALPANASDFEIVDSTGAILPHQRLGSGSGELINIALNRQGLADIIGSLHAGRIGNLSIQELHLERQGGQVNVEAIMAEDTAPNLGAWQRGLETIHGYLDDPDVSSFHIHARTAESLRVAFVAPQVPGHGYRAFYLRAKASQPAVVKLNPLSRAFMPVAVHLSNSPLGGRLMSRSARSASRPPYRLENEFLMVEVEKGGTLLVQDKRSGKICHGLNRFVDGGDCGDEYNYCPPPSDSQAAARLIRVRVERGPVYQSLEIKLELKAPVALTPDRKTRSRRTVTIPICSRIRLYPGVPRLDIQTQIDNRVRDHRLRVHFPMESEDSISAWYDGHFEVLQRPIGVPEFDRSWIEQPRPEVPQRAFTDLNDGQSGLIIANRGLPEVEVLKTKIGGEIALTLLRCVGWLSRDDFSTRQGHAGPFLATPGAQMLGQWIFDYAIIPHAGGWENAVEQALSFEVPLRGAATGIHDGALPASVSFIDAKPEPFVISAIKESEDGRGWLVRGYNQSGEPIQVSLQPWRRFKHAERVNLAEQKTEGLKVERDGSVGVAVGGHEIATVLFHE
jgi:mannosylglycerate hydrolase